MINLQSSVALQIAPITYSLSVGFGASEDLGGHYSSITADISLNANVSEDLPSQMEAAIDQAVADFVISLGTIVNIIVGDTIFVTKRIMSADYVQLVPTPG
jgi:hypothetical protein